MRVAVVLALGAVLALVVPAGAQGEGVALRLHAGQLLGLRVAGEDLPGQGLGGFYAQLYRAETGPNLLAEQSLPDLPRPLPTGFETDGRVLWKGKPSLAIKLPDREQTDSGEIEFHVPQVIPHHIYLLRLAHRGERVGGEFPPIIHIRQYDRDGNPVAPQQNLELLNGTYHWQEQVVSIPAVEAAASLALMLHHPAGVGRFWLGEISLSEVRPSPALSVPGHWETGARIRFRGEIPGTPIRLEAEARPGPQAVTIQATLSAPSAWLRSSPTAIVLGFRLPLQARGWRWGESLREEPTIQPGRSYLRYRLIGRRQFREVSWFPLAAVSGPKHGVALAVPLKPTLLNRLRYDEDGSLCAEFDLGLADRGRGAVERVTFSFDILTFPSRWGYRAALARYYAHYPELFASSARHGGWWIGPSDRVQGLQDFGLQYSEQHFARPDRTRAEDEMGLYTCSYSEPWMWRILVSEDRDVTLAGPLEDYWPALERDANLPVTTMDARDYWPAPRRESVRAFLNSVIHGPDGKPQINAVRTYAGTYMEMNTSCLPGIRSPRWGEMNRGQLSYRYETLEDARRCQAGGAQLDGVYFDSVGDWSDVSAEDHRGEHFAFASYPLTFSYATGTPIISGLAAMAEYMEFIRGQGYITMANSDSEYAGYAAPFLDMIGAGENFSGEAASDADLSHDRTIAYHKSVSFGNSGLISASPEEAERRFRLLLFYNIYPGIFYSNDEALERARPLYRRYIPLMRAMSEAGWEPVPWAALDDPELWLERYGPGEGAVAYYAVRNPTDQTRRAALTIEPRGLGREATRAAIAEDALDGEQLPMEVGPESIKVEVTLPARDTLVVRLRWPR